MDRRLALGALWAMFAAASVGVGFGAAGLVGDPFTPSDDAIGSVTAPSSSSAPASSASPDGSPSGSPSSSPTRSSRPTDQPSGSSSGSTAFQTEVRGYSTRAGFVSGSCRGGLVTVSASPAVGWTIDDVDSGRRDRARVRFERSDGEGKVEVEAWCDRGVPRFSVKDDDGGGGSSGSHGGDD